MWGYIRYLVLFVLLVCIGMVSIHLYYDDSLENNRKNISENMDVQRVLESSNQEEPKGEVNQEDKQENNEDTKNSSYDDNIGNNDSVDSSSSTNDTSYEVIDNSQDTISNTEEYTETSSEEDYIILDVQ